MNLDIDPALVAEQTRQTLHCQALAWEMGYRAAIRYVLTSNLTKPEEPANPFSLQTTNQTQNPPPDAASTPKPTHAPRQ